MTQPQFDKHSRLDRGEAVNLASNVWPDGSNGRPKGMRILADAVLRMDAELTRLYDKLDEAQALLGAANNALGHQASLLSAKDRELVAARSAELQNLSEDVLRCLPADWNPGHARDYSKLGPILAEYIDDLRVELERLRSAPYSWARDDAAKVSHVEAQQRSGENAAATLSSGVPAAASAPSHELPKQRGVDGGVSGPNWQERFEWLLRRLEEAELFRIVGRAADADGMFTNERIVEVIDEDLTTAMPASLTSAAPPSSTAPIIAWLHKDHATAYVITARVKELWEKVDPRHVENYTVPLYASSATRQSELNHLLAVFRRARRYIAGENAYPERDEMLRQMDIQLDLFNASSDGGRDANG